MENTFNILNGWVTKFPGNNGTIDLSNDERLKWHLSIIGKLPDNCKVLELGPMEGGHTKMIEDMGADVIAIEGDSDNFLKCLIVKNFFNLKAKFVFGDFNKYIEDCANFYFVSVAGVLYHQKNPVKLIYDLAAITDRVIVWSQVAGDEQPSKIKSELVFNDKVYYGKINTYKPKQIGYCGGLEEQSFWLYKEDMLKCFKDAGFVNIIQKEYGATIHGDSLLFVAKK